MKLPSKAPAKPTPPVQPFVRVNPKLNSPKAMLLSPGKLGLGTRMG